MSLRQASKCGVVKTVNGISNDYTDINKYVRFHSKRPYTIKKINDNMTMDHTKAGSVDAWMFILITNGKSIYALCFIFLDISLILNFLFKISDILIVFGLISKLTSVFKINKQVIFILFKCFN